MNADEVIRDLPKCRWRADIDNQLATLRGFFTVEKQPCDRVASVEAMGPQTYLWRDACDSALARRCREFLQAVPFDSSRPQCNDTDNPPQNSVLTQLSQMKSPLSPSTTSAPTGWTWEKYADTIWRLTPKTAEDFLQSPVFDLMTDFEAAWSTPALQQLGFNSSLRKATWVIQRTQQGHHLRLHNDYSSGRQLAFILYLTPDDWSAEDGGQLIVQDPSFSILPAFNTCVIFKMVNWASPYHCISDVEADDSKPRIALVGFWNE